MVATRDISLSVGGVAGAAQARGRGFLPLAPTGLSAIRPRTVLCNFSENAAAYMSYTNGTAVYTTEDFPAVAPNGARSGAKLVVAGAPGKRGYIETNTFTAAPSGSLPASAGMKPLVKAAGQILYALVYVDGDNYQSNTSYIDTIEIKWKVNDANYVSFFFASGWWLKSGWNLLVMRWDGAANASERQATVGGSVPNGASISRVAIGCQIGSTGMTFRVAEVGYWDAPPARPLIAMTFDGQYSEHISRVLPLLQSKGVRATFTTGAGYGWNDPSQATALIGGGMEVGQQVWQHINYPQAGDATYTSDLERALQVSRALGWEWRSQSMPFNDITQSQVSIAGGKGVRIIRGAVPPITPLAPWGLGAGPLNGCYGVGQVSGDNISLAALKSIADASVRFGGLYITTMHQVIAGGDGISTTGSATKTFVNDLSAFIDYALALGCTFVTLGEVVRSADAQAAIAP